MVPFWSLWLLCLFCQTVSSSTHRVVPYRAPRPPFVPLETIAVREVGKAMVAAYYSDTFLLHNVTLDAVRRTGKVAYELRDTPNDMYMNEMTVNVAGLAAELVFYPTENDDVSFGMAHPVLHTAYSIMYRYRVAHNILTEILMMDKCLSAELVALYMRNDDVQEEISM